jgi:hypothetical protein
MKNLFTLFFTLTLASSIAQTTPLYDVEFSTAESYASGELNQHNDWESTNNNWGSELTANATNGWVMVTGNWTRLHHQVPIKVTAEQNIIQLIVSFKPWNGGDTGNVNANTDSSGAFFSTGLHSVDGTEGLSKGDDGSNNTADDNHRVEYLYVSQNSKWKIGGVELNELAINRVGYHLKLEFIIGADAASSTSYAQLQQNDGTAIGSPVNIPIFPDALFNALKSDGNGGYFVFAAQHLANYVSGNDIRVTRVRANLLSTSTLDTQELNDFRFTLYPNPAKGVIGFQSELPLESVEIFSLTGSKVLSQSNNVEQVEVGNLAKGIYMLKASAADGKVATQKLIKE